MSISEERYSFAEVAKMLDVSLSSVWRWHLTGTKGKKLQSVLVGGRRFVLKSQLDAFCGMPQTASASQLRRRLAARKLDARIGPTKPQ